MLRNLIRFLFLLKLKNKNVGVNTNVPMSPVIFSTFDMTVDLDSPKSAIFMLTLSVGFSKGLSSSKLKN